MQANLTFNDYKEQIAALSQRQTDLFNQIPPFGIGDTGLPAREAIFAEIKALQEQRS